MLPNDKRDIEAMLSRGLGAAVLSTLPLEYGIHYASNIINIVFAVIFTTIFINSILLFIYSHRRGHQP